jgi:hypothetical protein
MKRTAVGEGARVRTFTPPRSDFDPLQASAAELRRHGFPARPQDPALLARYQQVFSQMKNRFRYVVPEFKSGRKKRRLPAKAPAVGTGNQIDPIWSGSVVFPPAGQAFRWITGEWTVPNVGAPAQDQTYYCACWVGIDGDSSVASTDLCQAGINMDVTQNGSSFTRDVYAWCEWLPGPECTISNFKVSFGDTVIVTLCTAGAGATEATVFFANVTSGLGTSFVFDAPTVNGQQVALAGDSAQWVVERPALGEAMTPALLADYGQLFFSGCQAVSYTPDGSNSQIAGGGTQVRIDMIEGSGEVLSRGILVSDTVVEGVFVAPGDGLI